MVPNREGEETIQAVENPGSLFLIAVQDGVRVRQSSKAMASGQQCLSNVMMVVYFSIHDHVK